MESDFYNKVLAKVKQYKKSLENTGFADYDISQLQNMPQNEEELLAALDVIIQSSKELNFIMEEAPNSIFVSDSDGYCIRVNKAYETMTKITKYEVYGKNTKDLDAQGVFRPSVSLLALKEKRPVSVLQEINDIKNIVVTGVPVFNEEGSLFRAVTNAIKVDEVDPVKEYIEKKFNSIHTTEEPKPIIGTSRQMREILSLADMVKDTDSSILITGETGTGKGVLASYIHETGIRKDAPFIYINCGAIPENLLESELFGYESGAFTGADKKGKPGLVELSDGGTLFLDEISELPLILQVKMLHFLQTKKLTRVGGTKEIHINTRIIAASNKSLADEVQRGAFRSDLYYRINVIPIRIPPLRERKEDIKALTDYFTGTYQKKYNKMVRIDKASMQFILEHEWKGNVRELENYIERMVILNDTDWQLNPEEEQEENIGRQPDPDTTKNSFAKQTEAELIREIYGKYRSSYKVAEILGISQSTAYRKIKKYYGKD